MIVKNTAHFSRPSFCVGTVFGAAVLVWMRCHSTSNSTGSTSVLGANENTSGRTSRSNSLRVNRSRPQSLVSYKTRKVIGWVAKKNSLFIQVGITWRSYESPCRSYQRVPSSQEGRPLMEMNMSHALLRPIEPAIVEESL